MSRPLKARLGWSGYVGILAALHAKPMCLPDMPAVMGIGRDTLYRLIPGLYSAGWLHVSAWELRPSNTLPVYAFGPGDDAPAPTMRPTGRPVEGARILADTPSPEVIAFCSMLRAISDTSACISDIALETGSHRETIRTALDALVDAGLAHLSAWQPRFCNPTGPIAAHYKIGAGSRAKKPSKKARRYASSKRWRNSVKQREAFGPLLLALRPSANSEQEAA